MTDNSVAIKQFLEAGVHFGHRSNRWNPRMKKYIFMKRKGVHIIDLQKTYLFSERAYNYVRNVVANGGEVLFVGTKKQARAAVQEAAEQAKQHFIRTRWIGGLLTNFEVVSKSIHKLAELNAALADEKNPLWQTKKEMTKLMKKRDKLSEVFGGVLNMKKLPDLLFVVDASHERNAIEEAKLMKIPVCALVDTNSDPANIDVVIPANDDAIRSISLFVSQVATAAQEGRERYEAHLKEEEHFKKEGAAFAEFEEAEAAAAAPAKKEDKAVSPEKPAAPVSPVAKTAEEKTPAEQTESTIKASDVKELRALSNVWMMECKKALVEAKGDKTKALQLLKERGIAVAAKRSERETKEGRIAVSAQQAKEVTLIQLACETDFVAKTDNFENVLKEVLTHYQKEGENFLESEAATAMLNDASAKTGEKLQISQAVTWKAGEKEIVAAYLHSNFKVAVLVKLSAEDEAAFEKETFKQLAKDVAMQVAAMNPLALSPDAVKEEEKEAQKQVFLKQMEEEKKPLEIKEKIAAGKLAKYFSENCLLNMPFVKEPKLSVQQLVDQEAKKLGTTVKVLAYHRSQIG